MRAIVPARLSPTLSRLQRVGGAVLRRPALVASLVVTGLLLASRQLNLLEPIELNAYDRLMQLRPELPKDPRILIVEVTEKDIQTYGDPLKDATVTQLLKQLDRYQPAVIGLDIFRDVAQEPGHADLVAHLKNHNRIIPICERSNAENPGVRPPSGITDNDRIGFSDIPIDQPNGIVRRALLFMYSTLPRHAPVGCTTELSFSFQLARYYLEQKGIQPDFVRQGQWEYLKLGKAIFKPLSPQDGGYQHGDTGGYQILLNYRSSKSPAPSVSLSDVLANRIDPNLVKNRVVLIGVTAPSVKDIMYTPFSSRSRKIETMPGVMVHGHIVSQILSNVFDGRPQFWFLPEWAEILWIGSWTLTGGVLVRVVRHPGKLVLAEIAAVGLLLGASVALFFGSAWIPVVAPTLGLISAGTGVLAYSAYEDYRKYLQAEEQRRYIEEKAKEQEQNIAMLQGLLKERTYNPPTTQPDAPLSEVTKLPPDEGDADSTAIASAADFKDTPKDKVAPRKDTDRILAGHYKINRTLGTGGFGLTYLAQDTHLPGNPQCVVKQLKPARSDEKFLQIARRLFDTEAEILHKLHHPQIPRLLAHFEENKEFYLVQEFVRGHPLSDELPVDKRLPEEQVVELLESVLEILIVVHDHSVIHRDIKPSNIMRREQDSKVVLIDFGAVKQIQPQEETEHTVAIGTRGYAPPEQYAGHPNFASDIYALGMIGIQALTGIAPYQLPRSKDDEISWRHLANVSKEFADILDKMVRFKSFERYQSAAEVMKELEGLKKG